MTTIEKLEEQLNAKKTNLKKIKAEVKAIQLEITREVEKEHNRLKILLSDILIEASEKEDEVKGILSPSIINSTNCKGDIKALIQLINAKKGESGSETDEQSTPPAESDCETDEQDNSPAEPDCETDEHVNPLTSQPSLLAEKANASFN